MQWEMIDDDTYRGKVIGGWIVRSVMYGIELNDFSTCMVFVPDPNHDWKLE